MTTHNQPHNQPRTPSRNSSDKPDNYIHVDGSNFSIAQISASGQCFRMTEQEDGCFQVIAHGKRLRLKQETTTAASNNSNDNSEILMDCSENDFQTIWKPYFDLGTDYSRFLENIDPADTYLRSAISYGSGIRILRQDLWEMIISFIISQQNNIRRIRKCIETICAHYGTRVENPGGSDHPDAGTCPPFYLFPTPDQLAAATEEDLRTLGLGYRSRYIVETARSIVSGKISLNEISRMDYASARAKLLELYGVGVKVADCICLFGLHHLEAFPVDTHIRQVLTSHYPDGFPFESYAGYQGVLQQYIFYYDLKGND